LSAATLSAKELSGIFGVVIIGAGMLPSRCLENYLIFAFSALSLHLSSIYEGIVGIQALVSEKENDRIRLTPTLP
jgi:hypothetical protein